MCPKCKDTENQRRIGGESVFKGKRYAQFICGVKGCRFVYSAEVKG